LHVAVFLCECVRDGVMLLGAGVNLAVSAELHYVIGYWSLFLLHIIFWRHKILFFFKLFYVTYINTW